MGHENATAAIPINARANMLFRDFGLGLDDICCSLAEFLLKGNSEGSKHFKLECKQSYFASTRRI